jgi:large subunit ribosomal protein L1
MGKRGKKYREAEGKKPEQVADLSEAVGYVKSCPVAKFDETVEMAIKLGIDPKKSEHAVRGTVSLPHGTGKNVTVLVFAAGPAADAAKEAGADYVGYEDMIEKVKSGWTDFDVAIATRDAMKEVKKLGRVLGPRGLMPNPKTGTVTDDTALAVNQSKAGKVEFRMDRHGNISVPFGKISFEAQHLVENGNTIIDAVKAAKPAGAKGTYIKNCTVATTMGPGVRVAVKE